MKKVAIRLLLVVLWMILVWLVYVGTRSLLRIWWPDTESQRVEWDIVLPSVSPSETLPLQYIATPPATAPLPEVPGLIPSMRLPREHVWLAQSGRIAFIGLRTEMETKPIRGLYGGMRIVMADLLAVARKGDADADGDVDLEDFTQFRRCLELSGPGRLTPEPQACAIVFSFDDLDVDLQDFASLQRLVKQ